MSMHDLDQVWQRGQITHLNTCLSQPNTLLATRIAQTIAWCGKPSTYKLTDTPLRTYAIQARAFHQGGDDMVCDVGRQRQQALQWQSISDLEQYRDLAGGKLLLYFPQHDLEDGMAEIESQGYFDRHSTPPWDTWIAFGQVSTASSQMALLAYVPAKYVEVVEFCLGLHGGVCLRWLGDGDKSEGINSFPFTARENPHQTEIRWLSHSSIL